jgi:long-chain acyl-CoA synthetase
LKNGKNIYPEELEILINELPYVSESMVFGKKYNTKADRNEDLSLCAKIVYNQDIMKEFFPNVDLDEYHNIIWNDIKNKINKSMPSYKYIKEIIVTDEPLIKTTTQKIKRFEEMKKINENNL